MRSHAQDPTDVFFPSGRSLISPVSLVSAAVSHTLCLSLVIVDQEPPHTQSATFCVSEEASTRVLRTITGRQVRLIACKGPANCARQKPHSHAPEAWEQCTKLRPHLDSQPGVIARAHEQINAHPDALASQAADVPDLEEAASDKRQVPDSGHRPRSTAAQQLVITRSHLGRSGRPSPAAHPSSRLPSLQTRATACASVFSLPSSRLRLEPLLCPVSLQAGSRLGIRY